jgi:3-hydroxyacyl-CoA dehydrogenase
MVDSPIVLDSLRKDSGRVLAQSAGASLIDLDDGVLCLEFHSKGNTLDTGTLEVADRANELIAGTFRGLVIGNQGADFSFGANLRFLLGLLDRYEDDRTLFRDVAKRFQALTTRMRTAPFPVVAAPFGLTIGGALELTMYADRVQGCTDMRASLPEIAVGIIPDLGGTSELYARCVEACEDPARGLQRAFDTIAFARSSADANGARALHFLQPHDAVTHDRALLLDDAKRAVLALTPGYAAPQHRDAIPVLGDRGYEAIDVVLRDARDSGAASDYDVEVCRALARVMTGGAGAARTVTHAELLDLETLYFESLVWRPQTRARMQHMLDHGQPLRN